MENAEKEIPLQEMNMTYTTADPELPDEKASEETWSAYKDKVYDYSYETLAALKETKYDGEDLWIEFTATFRPSSLENMTSTLEIKWVEFLLSRNVFVTKRRGYRRSEALKEALMREKHIPLSAEAKKHEEEPLYIEEDDEEITVRKRKYALPNKEEGNNEEQKQLTTAKMSTRSGQFPVSGITSIMRAFDGREKYSGDWQENLDEAIETYDSMARLCRLSPTDKAESLPVMLKGDALSFYNSNFEEGEDYESIIRKLKRWYTGEQQRQRLLIYWQSLRLTTYMQKEPDKSESEVFQKLTQELTRTQKRLAERYRLDAFLRDQLSIAVDLTRVQQSLRERVPLTAQEAIQRIATFLSTEPNSAGAHSATTEANYTLGNRYGGNARKTMRGSKYSSSRRNTPRISSKWLAGKKGCWVCGESHRARERHSKEEIMNAISKLRKKHAGALICVDDMALIADELIATENFIAEQDEDDTVFSDSEQEDAQYFSNSNGDTWKSHEREFSNNAFAHGRSFETDVQHAMHAMNTELGKGEKTRFNGIYLDTGANRSSIMSLEQYKAYCNEFSAPFNIDYSNKINIKGVGGKSKAIGSVTLPIPFIDLNIVIDITFKIVDQNLPTLLSNKDMIDNGLDISLQKQTISFKHHRQSLDFENYFLIHRWKRSDMTHCLYTENELRRLHRVFGHPSVGALTNLLRRAGPEKLTRDVENAITEITHSCTPCAINAAKPRRFKITVGTADLRFNHVIAVDILYLDGKPAVHIVDEATHFTNAKFLRNNKASTVWKAILSCWTRIYSGPPDFIRIDQGSNFIAREFLDSADAEGITVLSAPIESPNTMSHVERYHGPLRSAYNKIRESLPRTTTDDECLQMAVKAVNDTIGPEGLCPTLLVFGTIPRPLARSPAISQIERARAIDSAMETVRKEQAKRRVAFGLKHPSGPKGQEQSERLRSLPSGSPVFVYREHEKKWKGPFPLIQVDGETVIVQLPSGRKIFRTTVVKPRTYSHFDSEKARTNYRPTEDPSVTSEAFIADIPVIQAMFDESETKGDYTYTCMSEPTAEHTFIDSRKKEIDGLFARGTFEIVKKNTVPKGQRIYGTRFVDVLKKQNGQTIEKSRLVAQNYRDYGATYIPTRSPTISRYGQRVVLNTAALFSDHEVFSRDISQAYVQSNSTLERPIYLKAPVEFGLEKDEVLLVKKPLYGIPESGLHWFVTYRNHHVNDLEMKPTRGDPCLLYNQKDGKLQGVIILQVDDTLGHGTSSFTAKEEQKSKRFISKPRTVLTRGTAIVFNGATISCEQDGSFYLKQPDKMKSLKIPTTKDELVSVRAKAQYIGCCSRPDICAQVQLLAGDMSQPTEMTYATMEKVISRCHKTAHVGLRYVSLDRSTLRLALFTDSSFANAQEFRSQIGFVLVLADGQNRANIVHYGSAKCRRVARSVMAAELMALVYGFDFAIVIQDCLKNILDVQVPIDAYTDSKTVFNVIAKSATTLEKRLLIDCYALKQSHEKGELRNMGWIPGDENIADGMTKGLVNDNHPLYRIMLNNELYVHPQGWIERTTRQKRKL